MLGGIGTGELILIITVLVVLFGKKRTTEIAQDIGEATKDFRRMSKDYEEAAKELEKPLSDRPLESQDKKETGQELDHKMITSAKSNPEGGEERG